MAKKSERTTSKIRVQIPVSEELAKAITEFSEQNERSLAWTAGMLLGFSTEYRNKFGSWLMHRARGRQKGKKSIKWRQTNSSSEVRLQISVPENDYKIVEDIGDCLNMTPVRAAALLLDFGLDEFGLDLKIMSSMPIRQLREYFGRDGDPNATEEANFKYE